ncbi:MAG: glycosyltransferase [Negativicutes bacterium]|nr:glycosyltransferase [Negativicutes bacterium]
MFIWQGIIRDNTGNQQELLRRRYLILAEIDDDPLFWPAHQANDFLTFRSCHGVQVSTEPLAEFLRQYNPNVAVFANQLASLPPPRTYGDDGIVRIFFGALNRATDWLKVMPELNRLLRRYDERVVVTVIHDQRFFEALDTREKQFRRFCPYDEYQAILRQADIAILPLEPTRFNSMKSDLKFLECAGHGVAALASPTVYEGSIADRQTGMIYRTPAEFGTKLASLIDDRELRRGIAANAYAWVADTRLLGRHYRERYDWYRAMAARLPELNRELELRVPGILPGGLR